MMDNRRKVAGFYFAYGSNLNDDDRRRWSDARRRAAIALRPIARAWLPDHEVVFGYESQTRNGGVLDVRARRGSAVPGVVYGVDAECWAALDRKEGAPGCYERAAAVALSSDGRWFEVDTYVVTSSMRRRFVAPDPAYVDVVCEGLRRNGHDADHVRAAAAGGSGRCGPRSVFVYGTLLSGELRHAAIARHKPSSVVKARTRGQLFDLGEYPGMVPAATEDDDVTGELVSFDDIAAALTDLDAIEGFNGYGSARSLFRRALTSVRTDAGESVAWTYLVEDVPEHAARIESGDWRRR